MAKEGSHKDKLLVYRASHLARERARDDDMGPLNLATRIFSFKFPARLQVRDGKSMLRFKFALHWLTNEQCTTSYITAMFIKRGVIASRVR